MRNKLTVVVGGLLFAWLGWMSWRHATPVTSAGLDLLRPDVPYSLPVVNNQSVFDLEFGPHDAYRLLVSNFGSVAETARVTVQSEPISRGEHFPGERVAPLTVRPLQVGETAEQAALRASGPATGIVQQAAVSPLSPAERILPVGYVAATQEREFYLHVTDGALENPEGYVRVAGVAIAEGAHSRVYLDRQEQKSPAMTRLAEELVQVFEDEVLPRTKATLGTHRDVDGDGRLSLLLTPWLGKLQGGETNLKGFTRSSDFRVGIPAPYSNQCDVIYLNSQLRPGPMLRDLLAHEYAHAVSFSLRQGADINSPSLPDEEDWLNEGVAHLAENLSGSGWTNLDYRVSRFLDDPARYPLIVADYYRAGLWREHGCRGATYLLLRWCADVWGNHLPAALLRSPNAGASNLERLTGVPFPQLYRHFNLALAAESRQAGSATADNGNPVRPLETVSLFGRLGNWQLAGPRWDSLDVSTVAHEVNLRGTATAFLELRSSEKGIRRIRVIGKPGSHLQVTLIRCRPDAPSLNVAAAWEAPVDSNSAGNAVVSNSVGLFIDTTFENSRPLQIESVALEQNVEETRRSVPAHSMGAPVSVDLPAGQGRTRFVIPREAVVGATKSWRVKVIGQDPLGRRVSATATLPEWRDTVPEIAVRERPIHR